MFIYILFKQSLSFQKRIFNKMKIQLALPNLDQLIYFYRHSIKFYLLQS